MRPSHQTEGVNVSIWGDNQISGKVLEILRDVPDAATEHHLGRPFLTAYQIAIELNRRHPEAVAALGYEVGGLGTGEHNSLSQYIAQNLSRKINAGQLDEIEGGFISNWHLADIAFVDGDRTLHSSLTHTQFTVSVYRLRT